MHYIIVFLLDITQYEYIYSKVFNVMIIFLGEYSLRLHKISLSGWDIWSPFYAGDSWSSLTGLTHWGQVTHICVRKLNIIGSDNGLSPGRRQAIIWTNAGILLIGIEQFSVKF